MGLTEVQSQAVESLEKLLKSDTFTQMVRDNIKSENEKSERVRRSLVPTHEQWTKRYDI